MLNALEACQEHPTILLQLEDMRSDLRRFTYKLFAMLGQSGVYHLQMPPRKVLDSEFGKNLKPKREARPENENAHKGVSLSRNQVCNAAIVSWLEGILRCTLYWFCACSFVSLLCLVQTALYSALLMVANSANMGLSEDSRRAAAVLRLYHDTLSEWGDF